MEKEQYRHGISFFTGIFWLKNMRRNKSEVGCCLWTPFTIHDNRETLFPRHYTWSCICFWWWSTKPPGIRGSRWPLNKLCKVAEAMACRTDGCRNCSRWTTSRYIFRVESSPLIKPGYIMSQRNRFLKANLLRWRQRLKKWQKLWEKCTDLRDYDYFSVYVTILLWNPDCVCEKIYSYWVTSSRMWFSDFFSYSRSPWWYFVDALWTLMRQYTTFN